MAKNLITDGEAIVRKLTVMEDLAVGGTMTFDELSATTVAADLTTTSALEVGGSRITLIGGASDELTFGTIAAGAVATATITSTGRQVGDIVLPNAPTLEAGLIFVGAEVTAADTITFRVANISDSPITPAAAVYRSIFFAF